jgi:hypothetical protein
MKEELDSFLEIFKKYYPSIIKEKLKILQPEVWLNQTFGVWIRSKEYDKFFFIKIEDNDEIHFGISDKQLYDATDKVIMINKVPTEMDETIPEQVIIIHRFVFTLY